MNFHCLLISRHMPWEILTFSMVFFCFEIAFRVNFSVFHMRWTFPATETRFLGTAGALISWKWPKTSYFRQEPDEKTVFWVIFAVLCRFRQGASRKTAFCLWGPGKRAFSMVFLHNDSFSGLSFSVLSDALDISGNRNEVLGTAGAQICWQWPKRYRFRQELDKKTVFRVIFKSFSPFLLRRQLENCVLSVGTLKMGVFEGIFSLR